MIVMAASPYIRVMISSRCTDVVAFGGKSVPMSELRIALKNAIQSEKLFGTQLFDVWINEDSPPDEGTADAWDACMEQVRSADLVIVLYNGNAGWTRQRNGIGICHAELQTGLAGAA